MKKAIFHLDLGKPQRSRNRNSWDGWQRFSSPTKFSSLYQRFPTTFTLIAPYILLILPTAFVFGNSDVWFLIGVASFALTGTILGELFGMKRRRYPVSKSTVAEYGPGLFWLSFIAIAVSSVVGVAAAYGGKGSVAVQIGIAEISSGFFGTVDSITAGWSIVGTGMLFAAYVGGQCSRRSFFFVIILMLLAEVIVSFFTQITAPLLSRVILVAMLMLLFGLVGVRVVIAAILAALIIWPIMFDYRNELRIQEGVGVSEKVDAFDRIRFDLQFSRAQELVVPLDIEVTTHLQHPSAIDVLRFGIVPRFLDPDRKIVSTGQVINVALGGTATSAYTFGPVTTAYVLEGPVYLATYYFLLAVIVNLIWRRGMKITPIRLILLALILNGPLGWFSTFPDASIGTVQSLVSALPFLLILFLIRKRKRHSTVRSLKQTKGSA